VEGLARYPHAAGGFGNRHLLVRFEDLPHQRAGMHRSLLQKTTYSVFPALRCSWRCRGQFFCSSKVSSDTLHEKMVEFIAAEIS
jgi:hypothetical protein